jgi:hypothetical protein
VPKAKVIRATFGHPYGGGESSRGIMMPEKERRKWSVRSMTWLERGQEIERLRKLIREHKGKKGNARCHHNDKKLYKESLPEGSRGMGVMELSEKEHLRACKRYVRRQQCGHKCPFK